MLGSDCPGGKMNEETNVRPLLTCITPVTPNGDLRPLSHQTAMPQRLYSVLKPVSALWERREIRLNITFIIYPTAFPQRTV